MAKPPAETEGFRLPIGRKHRIVGSALNYVLERNVGSHTTPRWGRPTYHTTLDAAVSAAYTERVRTADADGVEAIARRIEEIREEFRRDLAPLLTAPAVG